MKSKLLFVSFAIVFALGITNFLKAQISVEGKPLSNTYQLKANIETFTMPSFDVEKMLREDAFESQFKDIPPRFGKDFDVNFGYKNSGTIDILPNGTKVWRLAIRSPKAVSINLIFDKFNLPKGSTFFIYSKDKRQVFGAYTDINNQPSNIFSTTPCMGEEIILEYNAPLGLRDPEINLSSVIHAYKNVFNYMPNKDYGTSGACNRNVFCPDGDSYRDQIRSVALIINAGGTRYCTGSMVNNTRFDATPFFLTANHCISGQNVATWVFVFKYEAPTCPNPGGDGPLTFSINGSTLLANNSHSDFALLKLSTKPPPNYNVYYNGWSRSNVPSTGGIGIHHPDGDVKKISYAQQTYTPTSYNNPAIPGDSSHWHVFWTTMPGSGQIAITEGGSSGSPVYDHNKRVIGQLHGGPSSCTATDKSDYYGKFDRSWNYGTTPATRLKDWLDSANTGVMFVDGYDPNSVPLNTYSLQSPATGTTVTSVPGSNTVYTFNWDTSSAAATYKWIFGTSLPTRQLTIPVQTKPFNITLGKLDSLLTNLGVPQGGSINGSWDVWAFRNNPPANDSIKASNGPRTITFTRILPPLSTFSLVSPANNARLETEMGSALPVKINWSKSGAGTTYKWFYASPNFSSTANIKFRITSDNSGFDSLLTTTKGNLDLLLAGIGVAQGDSSVGQWRVYAYSGSDSLASSQTNNITFKRLPISIITIGTGTTSSNFPFTTYWKDGRTQYLYLGSELNIGSTMAISQIGFDVISVGGPAMTDFKVSFQNTTATTLSGFVNDNWTLAYNPPSYAPTAPGWNMIQLTTPFTYTGGNLLVDICYNNTTYTSYSTVNCTAAPGMYWGRYNDLTEPNGGCGYTAWTLTTGPVGRANTRLQFTPVTGISNHNQFGSPINYSLSQNYPNPFNPVTKINFAIPKQGIVSLKIYDVLGREVKTLVNEIKSAGFYSVDFNGNDFASGVYFYRLESESFRDTKRMLLIK
ncbi:MAG: T9SS type A sorting domain-containing protein [Candidatus Kapaibacterium sp.]